VELQNFSDLHISAVVHDEILNLHWKFTGFYWHSEAAKRQKAWELLTFLARTGPTHWMCIVDYNEIVSVAEKSGGNIRQNSLMQDFRQTLEACELVDLGYIGPKFTWSNYQEGTSLIRERLDRGCANHDWKVSFLEAEIYMDATINSNHAPLLLYMCKDLTTAKRKPWFLYKASWGADARCQELITKVWGQMEEYGNSWDRLGRKLSKCKRELI
jgi:hypothetical protein